MHTPPKYTLYSQWILTNSLNAYTWFNYPLYLDCFRSKFGPNFDLLTKSLYISCIRVYIWFVGNLKTAAIIVQSHVIICYTSSSTELIQSADPLPIINPKSYDYCSLWIEVTKILYFSIINCVNSNINRYSVRKWPKPLSQKSFLVRNTLLL